MTVFLVYESLTVAAAFACATDYFVAILCTCGLLFFNDDLIMRHTVIAETVTCERRKNKCDQQQGNKERNGSLHTG